MNLVELSAHERSRASSVGGEKKQNTTVVMVNEHVINIVLSQTYLLGSSSAVNFALNQSSVSRDEQMT